MALNSNVVLFPPFLRINFSLLTQSLLVIDIIGTRSTSLVIGFVRIISRIRAHALDFVAVFRRFQRVDFALATFIADIFIRYTATLGFFLVGGAFRRLLVLAFGRRDHGRP